MHVVTHHSAFDATAFMKHFHPPVIGSHQRAFAGRERNIKFTIGMFTPHQQRPGKAQRDLGYTGEMLYISLCEAGVQRILSDVFKTDARLVADEFLARSNNFLAIVVLRITRDFPRRMRHAPKRIDHFDCQFAERLAVEIEFKLVLSFVQGIHGQVENQ